MKPKQEEKIFKMVFWVIAFLTVGVLLLIIGDVLIKGLKHVTLEFLLENPRNMGKEGGIFSSIVSTIYLIGLSLLIATPIGIGASIFLVEYKTQGIFLKLIRFTTESLAGIPSIVFGIFGFGFFVIILGMGWSILAGSLTLAIMVLPVIIRTAEEAIIAVPNPLREGSLALGASKWQTIVKVVIPTALPGIITGVILSTGRAVGESAAVILTAGSALGIPTSLLDPGRSLAVHLYVLAVEGISMEKAYATGAFLVIAVILVNILSNLLTAKQRGKVS